MAKKATTSSAKPAASKAPAKASGKTAAGTKSTSAKGGSASTGTKRPNALAAPVKVSKDLQGIVGGEVMPRTEVTKKLWEYIKGHKLQDSENKRIIHADAKLEKVFGKKSVNMFEMTKLVSGHLTKG